MRLSAKSEFRKRRETDFLQILNRVVIIAIVIGAMIMAILTFYPEFRRIEEMKANLARLEEQRTEEELLLRRREREEKWLTSDPEYIELLARERLGVMKEGETIFRLDLEAPTTGSTP